VLLRRRTALLAGAASLGVAATGLALVEEDVLPGRPFLHRALGLNGAAGTIPDVPIGSIVYGTLPSGLVAPDPEYRILYPSGSSPGDPMPLVMVLHPAGGGADETMTSLGLPQFLAASGQRLAIALVDGHRDYWQAQTDGDSGRMVLEELLPLLERRGLDVTAPAWLGWSMGGYGVLRLAAERQRAGLANGPVCAVSPALWPSYDEIVPGAFRDRAEYDVAMGLLATEDVPDRRIDCGTGDPFYRNVREFADGTDIETHFSGGGHDAGYWTRMLPDELAWLGERLSG
jgi:S-formylglutathione hydrolase FrmB